METSKTIKFLEDVTEMFSPTEIKIIQTLPGNYNKQMITHQTSIFDKIRTASRTHKTR